MVVRSRAELKEQLEDVGEGRQPPVNATEGIGHRPLFVFTGQVRRKEGGGRREEKEEEEGGG